MSRGVGKIVTFLQRLIEEPVQTPFRGVVAFHPEDLFAGWLAADAGRSGVSDGAGFGRQVLNGDRYVPSVRGVHGNLTLVRAGRAVLAFILARGRLRAGVELAGARVRRGALTGVRAVPGGGGGFLAGAGLGQLIFGGEERCHVTVVL